MRPFGNTSVFSTEYAELCCALLGGLRVEGWDFTRKRDAHAIFSFFQLIFFQMTGFLLVCSLIAASEIYHQRSLPNFEKVLFETSNLLLLRTSYFCSTLSLPRDLPIWR